MKCQPDCTLVLLSSFNGESHIEQQVKSIQNQDGVCTHLIIRDDGSTDKTVEILHSLINPVKDILFMGANVGIQKSFYLLFELSMSYDFEFICTSDQDDVWFSNKVVTSLEFLKQNSKIHMYSSQRAAFSNSRIIRNEIPREGLAKIEWFLFENPSYGNTQFFRRELIGSFLKCVAGGRNFQDVPIDLNIARFAAACSRLYIDSRQLVNYRLHKNNAVGIRKREITKFLYYRKFKNYGAVRYLSSASDLIQRISKFGPPIYRVNENQIINALLHKDSKELRLAILQADLRTRGKERIALRACIFIGLIPAHLMGM
jgi:rhamnosyltransferase